MNKVEFIHAGGGVRRFHTLPMLKEDTVAQHSFGVAWFCSLLMNGSASASILMAALTHDLAEQFTGDLPAPAKRELGLSKQFEAYEETQLCMAGIKFPLLTDSEKRTLKMADCMDGAMRCATEVKLGNAFAGKPFHRFISYINELSPTPFEYGLLQEILTYFEGDSGEEIH